MRTEFSQTQLTDLDTSTAANAIRKCVHCGFCLATCPTYELLGNELDSPRGRIYLMKDILEKDRCPTSQEVKHLDRCLSCLACKTTCPSGVDYMHLIDHTRQYIEARYRRPLAEKSMRWMLSMILPYPTRFRTALHVGQWLKLLIPLFGKANMFKPFASMLGLVPTRIAGKEKSLNSITKRYSGRVALLRGCAEPVLKPEYQQATVRVLNRLGYEVISTPGERCCGALTHHLGKTKMSLQFARHNVDMWHDELQGDGLDAILVTASGCGTTLKDYGHLLREDGDYAAKAAMVSNHILDISEFLSKRPLAAHLKPNAERSKILVAYHAPCTLQHGQNIVQQPQQILREVGFRVVSPRNGHMCCGSAGTYNILQRDLAMQLGKRKATSLSELNADVIATGNAGCAIQLGLYSDTPIVHTVELIDWATGGRRPESLAGVAETEPELQE